MFVCLTLLASFFLASHLSLKTCICTCIIYILVEVQRKAEHCHVLVGASWAVVPWGGRLVAWELGMVAREGGGEGGHRTVLVLGQVAPYTALDRTSS